MLSLVATSTIDENDNWNIASMNSMLMRGYHYDKPPGQMKIIDTYKSPNFDNRNKHLIKYIILHYTAMTDCFEAIEYLCGIQWR